MTFVGYSDQSKTYKSLDLLNKPVAVRRDIIFDKYKLDVLQIGKLEAVPDTFALQLFAHSDQNSDTLDKEALYLLFPRYPCCS